MSVAGITPTASQLIQIGGESTDGLALKTHDNINSAGCEGMAITVTAAHHSIWRHLYDSNAAAQKPKKQAQNSHA